MARVLIVGCGCRGRTLAAALAAEGHAARGTSRREAELPAIEAAGVEAVTADPDRLSTLTPHLEGTGVLCWLMGSAAGDEETVAALHGHRLESTLETIVDTHVRGLVYEGAGAVSAALLTHGAELVRRASVTYRMPVEVVERDPSDHEGWVADMVAAVARILAA